MTSSSLKKLTKGSLWLILTNIITRLSGLISLPILARLLGPTDLGIYNLLQNVIQTADGLSRLGIDAAMHRYGAQHEITGNYSVGRLFGVGSCLIISSSSFISVCLWLFKQIVAQNFLGEVKIEPWLGLTAFTVFTTAIGNPSWVYLVALQAFKVYSLRTSVVTIAGAIITLLLTWQLGLAGSLWSFAIIAVVQTFYGWWLTIPVLNKHKIQLHFDYFIPEMIKILKFGLPFYASNFLSSFVGLPLLGYVSKSGGIEQLGYLRVAQSLSQFVSFLPTAIAPVLISSLSASLAGDTKDYQNLKSLHLRVLWSVLLFTSVAISFNLDWIIGLLFGATYQDAIILSRLTIWITAINSLVGMMGQYVTSLGNTRAIAIIQTTSLAITVVIAMLLIPKYNSVGLLVAQAISGCFTLIAYIRPALADIDKSDHKYLWLLTFTSVNLFIISFLTSFINFNISVNIILSFIFLGMTLVLTLLGCFTKSERLSAYLVLSNLISKFKFLFP